MGAETPRAIACLRHATFGSQLRKHLCPTLLARKRAVQASAGADILAVNGAGRTALQIAEESNNHDVAQLLRERVQHGAARTASGGV